MLHAAHFCCGGDKKVGSALFLVDGFLNDFHSTVLSDVVFSVNLQECSLLRPQQTSCKFSPPILVDAGPHDASVTRAHTMPVFQPSQPACRHRARCCVQQCCTTTAESKRPYLVTSRRFVPRRCWTINSNSPVPQTCGIPINTHEEPGNAASNNNLVKPGVLATGQRP